LKSKLHKKYILRMQAEQEKTVTAAVDLDTTLEQVSLRVEEKKI